MDLNIKTPLAAAYSFSKALTSQIPSLPDLSRSLPKRLFITGSQKCLSLHLYILLLELHDKSPFSAAHFYLDNHATLMNLTKPWASTDSTIHRIYSLSKILPFPISFTYVPATKATTEMN